MFEVRCPHCQKILKLAHRKGLIFSPFILCVYCMKKIQTNKTFRYVNSGMLGFFTFLVGKSFFPNVSPMIILCMGITLIVFFQGIFNLFYSLESAEDDFDF